ncbi:MAG: hypothetical protein JWP40_1549 [Blastococcus sp.]|nr:hypothetical protein [Blastococcus sp.]
MGAGPPEGEPPAQAAHRGPGDGGMAGRPGRRDAPGQMLDVGAPERHPAGEPVPPARSGRARQGRGRIGRGLPGERARGSRTRGESARSRGRGSGTAGHGRRRHGPQGRTADGGSAGGARAVRGRPGGGRPARPWAPARHRSGAAVGAVEHVDQPGQRQRRVAAGEVGRHARRGRSGLIAGHVASSKLVTAAGEGAAVKGKPREPRQSRPASGPPARGRVTEPLSRPAGTGTDPSLKPGTCRQAVPAERENRWPPGRSSPRGTDTPGVSLEGPPPSRPSHARAEPPEGA